MLFENPVLSDEVGKFGPFAFKVIDLHICALLLLIEFVEVLNEPPDLGECGFEPLKFIQTELQLIAFVEFKDNQIKFKIPWKLRVFNWIFFLIVFETVIVVLRHE